jgi:hypothetical protein
MEQLAWTLRHHIGEGWMRSSYHLSMPTRSTHQLFSSLNRDNPRTKLSLLKRDKRSKLK